MNNQSPASVLGRAGWRTCPDSFLLTWTVVLLNRCSTKKPAQTQSCNPLLLRQKKKFSPGWKL